MTHNIILKGIREDENENSIKRGMGLARKMEERYREKLRKMEGHTVRHTDVISHKLLVGCIHTYMHKYIHAYILTCIHIYIHTYIHT